MGAALLEQRGQILSLALLERQNHRLRPFNLVAKMLLQKSQRAKNAPWFQKSRTQMIFPAVGNSLRQFFTYLRGLRAWILGFPAFPRGLIFSG